MRILLVLLLAAFAAVHGKKVAEPAAAIAGKKAAHHHHHRAAAHGTKASTVFPRLDTTKSFPGWVNVNKDADAHMFYWLHLYVFACAAFRDVD